MPTTIIKTRVDVVEHLMDWSGSVSPDAVMLRQIHRAIEAAYREVTQNRNWSYTIGRGRLNTNAEYNTGTIAYTHSSRTVALTSGTWPSWAAYGVLQIAGVEYEVASRTSDSAIVLSVNSNPGANVASGTSYTLYRREYPLPVDFQAMGTIRNASSDAVLSPMTTDDLMSVSHYNLSPAEPTAFSIQRDSNYIGTVGLFLDPPPDSAYQYDYTYKRRPRQFTTYQYNTGTVTTSSTTLTGSGTTFLSNMVGCVIRFGSTTALPTGSHGTNPFVANRVITAYSSATSLTLDQALDSELTAVKYEISDPIDIESGATYTAFLRWAEYELGVALHRKDAGNLMGLAREAMITAYEQDNRNIGRRPGMNQSISRVPVYYDIVNDTD